MTNKNDFVSLSAELKNWCCVAVTLYSKTFMKLYAYRICVRRLAYWYPDMQAYAVPYNIPQADGTVRIIPNEWDSFLKNNKNNSAKQKQIMNKAQFDSITEFKFIGTTMIVPNSNVFLF